MGEGDVCFCINIQGNVYIKKSLCTKKRRSLYRISRYIQVNNMESIPVCNYFSLLTYHRAQVFPIHLETAAGMKRHSTYILMIRIIRPNAFCNRWRKNSSLTASARVWRCQVSANIKSEVTNVKLKIIYKVKVIVSQSQYMYFGNYKTTSIVLINGYGHQVMVYTKRNGINKSNAECKYLMSGRDGRMVGLPTTRSFVWVSRKKFGPSKMVPRGSRVTTIVHRFTHRFTQP